MENKFNQKYRLYNWRGCGSNEHNTLSWVPFGQLSCPLKICKGNACCLCFRKSNYTLPWPIIIYLSKKKVDIYAWLIISPSWQRTLASGLCDTLYIPRDITVVSQSSILTDAPCTFPNVCDCVCMYVSVGGCARMCVCVYECVCGWVSTEYMTSVVWENLPLDAQTHAYGHAYVAQYDKHIAYSLCFFVYINEHI